MINAVLQQAHEPILDEQTTKVVTYAFIGAVYSSFAWINSRAKRGADAEPFDLKKFAQPVLIGAVAGVIVATSGQDATAVNLDAAMAVAIPMVNQLLNTAKMAGRVPSEGR